MSGGALPVIDAELARDMGELSRDPLKWVMYAFPWGRGDMAGMTGPDAWQRDVLAEIKANIDGGAKRPLKLAVASGHGVGKSALVAWLLLWSMSTCPDTRGVVTANTGAQLRSKTWAELSKWYGRFIAKHWFKMAATSMIGAQEGREHTWRLDAIQWSKNNSEAFAGLHNQGKRIIVVFDEASAIEDVIWDVTEGALTDKDTEIFWLCFGNPTRNTGRFRECFRKHRDRWVHKRVDSRDVAITNKEQIAQWLDDYGEDSDFFKVRVRGEFPDVSDTQLISSALVRDARARRLDEHEIRGMPKIMGIDVARTGGDMSSVWVRQGLLAYRVYKRHTPDSMMFADRLAGLIHEHKPDTVFIDMGAMGAPVYDRLRQMGFNNVQGVHFGGAAARDDLYVNRRIEMWFAIKKWLEDGGVLPDKDAAGQDIEDDLTSPEFFYSTKGKMQLESKEDMKERGLHSPDDGDALALTFAVPVRSANVVRRITDIDLGDWE